MKNKLLLSLFPGIDVLGLGFERNGFCVVKGPDKMLGGDNRNFHPPSGVFAGVIGGPPCQDFSKLNRSPSTYSLEMLNDYIRTVQEASPEFFLFENVACAPDFKIDGYTCQRFALDLAWFSEFSRLRYFVFGSKSGKLLNPMIGKRGDVLGGCVTGKDERSFQSMCEIQGLPSDFDLPLFTLTGKKQVIANAVPLPMAEYVAGIIKRDIYGRGTVDIQTTLTRRCACNCGRVVTGRAITASGACRMRLMRSKAA